MKIRIQKRSPFLWFLLGVIAVVGLGAVYIDATVNLLRSSGFGVQLLVTNSVAMTINGSRVDFPGIMTLRSNAFNTNIIESLGTNSTANTNYTWDMNHSVSYIRPTNHVSVTNIINMPSNQFGNALLIVESIGTAYNVVWPTFNAAQFSVLIRTNANVPIWSQATNGGLTVFSATLVDTQMLLSVTRW